MNVKELSNSRYLKKEEVGDGITATIKSVVEENVAMEGKPPEMAWIMYFTELEKPLWLKPTTGAQLAAICGSEESDNWIGKRVELYNDMGVSFNGTRGGIRIRKAHGSPAAAQQSTRLPTDPAVKAEVWNAFKLVCKPGTSDQDAAVMFAETVDVFFPGTKPKDLTTAQLRKMGSSGFNPTTNPLETGEALDPSDIPF